MSFIEELQWRGLLQEMTPGTEKLLTTEKVVGYIGFDPTAPSLTIGNFVPIMLLTLFQKHGHTPIVLMGGATGRIGDPSGKDAERQLKSEKELDENLKHQIEQVKRLLDFDEKSSNKAQIVNNYEFYKDMGVLDFLRDIGKHLTVNYMLSKESVRKRLDSGISFTEFSYQLIQGYDFLELYRKYDCLLQMGGSDQWGNITAGTEVIRRFGEGPAYALVAPLLTKSDGKKFGKSDEGNIWLDPQMTSPYKFYQFWINSDDSDIPTYFKYFSLRPKEEILAVEQRIETEPNEVKKELAEELTTRIHSAEACKAVKEVTSILFSRKASREQVLALSEAAFQAFQEEIPTYSVSRDEVEGEMDVSELLCDRSEIFKSKGEFRRAVQGNAVSINKVKWSSIDQALASEEWIHGSYLLVENGKKNKYLIVAR